MATENGTAEPVPPQGSASDLDSLLGEYETSTTQQPIPADLSKKIDRVVGYIDNQQTKETEIALDEVAKSIVGEKNVSQALAKHFLVGEAMNDKAIEEAFANRSSNPTAWKTCQDSLQKRFDEQFTSVDDQSTQDTQEIVAAVQGSSSTTTEPDQAPDYEGMSDVDFRKVVSEIR